MKYWLLTTEYPPFYGGGISTYCFFTCEMLAEKGHEVTVFVNDDSIKDFIISESKGIRLIRFNPARTGSSSFLGHTTNISYEFAAAVKHFIDIEGKPDLIEAQEYLGIAYYLMQFKHLLYQWCSDIPIVITMHSPSFLYLEFNHVPLFEYPNYWIGEMERYCLQAADLVLSPSQLLINEVSKRFELTNKSVYVVPNPYRISSDISEPEIATAEDQIIYFGKLSAQKGTFKLLSYFESLWRQGSKQVLYLIGGQDIVYHPEGRMMGEIIRQRYGQFIKRRLLIMEDKISPSSIKGRLSKAKLVIIPSTVENLPYVVFEMMELRRIVLVSKQGGHAEVIENGVNGFVFDHEDPQSFYAQLNNILSLSTEERIVIGRNAWQTVEKHFNYEAIYAAKIGHINALIKSKVVIKDQFAFIRNRELKTNSTEVSAKKDMLSIVVPYYNMGQYIDETIEAIRGTVYPEKEILIINDGSTEPSSIQKLAPYRNMKGIQVIDIENKGLAHARNYGATQAKGEFLAFLDADDKVSKDYYTKSIAILNQYKNIYFVGCWVQYFDGSRTVWPTFTPEPPLILFHNLVNSSALVYKRQAFLQAGLNDSNMTFQGLEDYESVISLIAAGRNGVVLPEVHFEYRVRGDSMIRDISKAKKLYLLQYISNKHKSFYATFAPELYNLLSTNGPGLQIDNPSLDYQLSNKIPFLGKFSGKAIRLVKRHKHIKSFAYKIYRLIYFK